MNEHKNYVITGASQGIGLATALRLANDGATIIVFAKESSDIQSICNKITESGGNPVFINTDIRSDESIIAAVRQLDGFEKIDGFIHCAAVVKLTGTKDISSQYIDLMYQVNARAPLLIAKHLHNKLQNSYNANIMIVSPPINLDPRWLSAHLSYTSSRYLASMHAVGLASELESFGIKVNTIWPKHSIASADICNIINGTYGDMNSLKRRPEIMADAIAIMMHNDDLTGECLIDEQILLDAGIENLDKYLCNKDQEGLNVNEFIS